jgi:hypothetical protein
MRKKLILTLSMILPNLLLASIAKNPITLKVESASESESLVVEKILSTHSNSINISKDKSNNTSVQLDESQEQIDELILKLQNGLGGSVKIEQLSNSKMKKGTQDF